MGKVCVFFVHGMSGGTATLSYRLSKEYRKRGFKVLYVCGQVNDTNNFSLFKQQNMEIIVSKSSAWYRRIKDKVVNADEVVVWVYSYELFSVAEKIKHIRKQLDTNIYLYVVHERCLIRGVEVKNGLYEKLCSWINSINTSYIKTVEQNNELLFMEQAIVELTETHLNMQFQNISDKVLALPYFFEEVSIDIENRKKIITTMARIDFPFKGYMIGLIDIFSRHYKEYGLELWIIGAGESEGELKEKIDSLNDDVRKNIKLLGNIEYSKIKDILKDSYVFVGMGTGILDAASVMLPSIGVQAYRYECLGNGFFNENPGALGYMSDKEELHSIEKELIEIFKLSKEEYKGLCYQENSAARNYYGIDKFLSKLESIHKGDKKHSLGEIIGYKINDILGKLNMRLHKK